MANSDEKISKFVQAITEYAEEQSRRIHQEVEQFKAERLLKAEREVLADAYQLIQKERAAQQSAISRDISRRELEARQALLTKRQQMMNEVFARATETLRAHAAGDAYAQRLQESMLVMAQQLPAEGTVYYVGERDRALVPVLTAACPAGSRVDTAADIRIGGLRGVNVTAGRLMDDTLDARLQQQRDWFTRTSGLTVE